MFIFFLVDAQKISTLHIDKMNSSDFTPGDIVKVSVFIDELTDPVALIQMYIGFDEKVLQYKSTSYVNPVFKNGWKDNVTSLYFAAVFISVNSTGNIEEQMGKLCELEFIYKGGVTDLIWGTEEVIQNGVRITGDTRFFDSNSKDIVLSLIDGCVCKLE